MQDLVLFKFEAVNDALILVVNRLNFLLKFDPLSISPAFQLLPFPVMRSRSDEVAMKFILKILQPLNPVGLNLALNFLNYGVRSIRGDHLFELILLHLLKGVLIEWTASELLHFALSLINCLLALLPNCSFTAEVVTQVGELHTCAIFLLRGKTFLDLVST